MQLLIVNTWEIRGHFLEKEGSFFYRNPTNLKSLVPGDVIMTVNQTLAVVCSTDIAQNKNDLDRTTTNYWVLTYD